MPLNEEQLDRYNRHIILSEIGLEGQQRICEAKVLVIGAGGLGSPVLLYLAAAGIGTIGIADNDVVDLTNLQRQVIHFTGDIHKEKVLSAKDKILQINPDVTVHTYLEFVDANNILEFIGDYDFIVDGTDNFQSKFLINDASVMANKPFSHAGVLQYIGQTMTVIPGESACYHCIFHKPPKSGDVPGCSQAGLLSTIPGVLGALQATEVLKYITGKGDLLTNRLMIFDALEMAFRNVKINRRGDCPVCAPRANKTLS